ncbi:hypothetical protein BV511_22955 [Methylorubrum extorquens]|uniref:DUF4062 domain-containing protein n=1 Tax=Methylorubrum extorquens TaxID=408 RepID=UPI000972B76C|nr:DUF4062 domain-containing protein [Methylorubrum extorquens]APX87313.1 hypothetical protein BV511_22955 [Methylorubrum extorquens]
MAEKRYQVFISSTFVDLQEERQKVIQSIMEMDCMPAGMELFPAMDQEQLDFIKSVIDDSDYYIIIIGARYGSVGADGVSYTEAEYDYAVSKGIKVIALIHDDPTSLPFAKVEGTEEGRRKLEEFKLKLKSGRLVRPWTRAEELPGIVALSLQKTIKAYPATGWIRGNSAASSEILSQINDLRLENSKLKQDLAEARAAIAEPPADLASGDDRFSLEAKYSHSYSSGMNATTIRLRWNDIVGYLGSSLMKPMTMLAVQSTLEIAIARHRKWTVCSITYYDVDTIGIHLSQLGLVSISAGTSTKGEAHIWWQWTDRGTRHMTQLRLVRKPETDEDGQQL